jgi:hypothetical protein
LLQIGNPKGSVMEEQQQGEPQEDVKLPEERVEDLEPEQDDAADVAGGKHIGNPKYEDIT